MFSKLAIFLASVAVLAVATPTGSSGGNGDVECCNTVGSASDPGIATELGLLGVVVQDANVLVGITCTPISVIGIGSGCQANAEPVCCENNSFVKFR